LLYLVRCCGCWEEWFMLLVRWVARVIWFGEMLWLLRGVFHMALSFCRSTYLQYIIQSIQVLDKVYLNVFIPSIQN
jgi:hypothetical protein